ncbi:MAG: Z1 domain-containing protein [Erysipelotrichaceae bacterium]|uniref:Z1 domain-containing protein n=1 Tax=Anaerorhabdus sp. TaxID=1872524 RepID=UPI002FC5B8C9
MIANNLDEYVNLVINALENTERMKRLDFEKEFSKVVKMYSDNEIKGFESLTEESIEEIKKRVMSRVNIDLELTNNFICSYTYVPWFKQRKFDLDMYFWNRYKMYLIENKHFMPKVVDKLDTVLDELVDLLGDPTVENFNRRGLIIGDVQSGKTATYIGLVNKAIDSGYNIIVLLTGTIEELRKQTQIRVDEGILGRNPANLCNEKIGVSIHSNDEKSVISVTNREKDFEINSAKSIGLNLSNNGDPIILVLKKNVSILDNLNKWIDTYGIKDKSKINNSILVIDDEADFASINTKKKEDERTKTNDLICSLLKKYNRTCYVGFTATPYANVFVMPNTDSEMENNSLFPQDFIYCLDTPNDYIGPSQIFGDGDETEGFGKYEDMIEVIKDESVAKLIPLKHKKDLELNDIPKSLKEAIRTFFIANAIRDIRGDSNKDRSMLINMSVFSNVHFKLRRCVEEYVEQLKRSIYANCNLIESIRNENIDMRELKETYFKEYKNIGTWENVLSNIYKAVANIHCVVINATSKEKLQFNQDKFCERVIVIGGFSLSRGLTLEGLIVSYFHRNSSTYDTLMQMGRWFGYRENYADICKIWMSEASKKAYIDISEATEELKYELNSYKHSRKTPLEFGIRVRNDINNLLITARNKMRDAQDATIQVSISGEVVETAFIDTNKLTLSKNEEVTKIFLSKSLKTGKKVVNDHLTRGIVGVNKKIICEFLSELIIPEQNIKFQNQTLSQFIEECKDAQLNTWDVQIISGSGEEIIFGEVYLRKVKRQIDFASDFDEVIRISGKRCRLGGPGDGRFGLNKEEEKMVRDTAIENARELGKKKKEASQRDHFSLIERRPLLTLYFIEPTLDEEDLQTNDTERYTSFKKNTTNTIIGYSIGVPKLSQDSRYIKYKTNVVYKNLQFNLDEDEEEEEENE